MKNIALAFPIMHLRAIAVVTAIAILAWTFGLPNWIHKAQAGGFDSVSDVMSDTDVGLDSTHSITFTTDTILNDTDRIRITFDPIDTPYEFDFSSVANTDVASSTTHTVYTAAGSCTAGEEFYVEAGDVNTTLDYIDYHVCTGDTVPAATTINFYIGATGATNFINNPNSEGSYIININSLDGALLTIDDADTRVAVIQDVLVTAQVDTIFNFTIQGTGAELAVNDDVVLTTGTTTATSIPFGVIAPGPGNAKLMAQILEINTNAQNGYAVTVFADQTLTAGNGATIDAFIDASEEASSTAWVTPAGTLGVDTTFGHWGLTSMDDAVSSTTANLWGVGESLYVGNFIQNPVEVLYHDAPVLTSSGNGVGSTTVAYKVEITNLQEAARDYQATLTYIATPVF